MTRSLQASVGFHSKSALIAHYRNKLMSSISDVTDGLLIIFNNQMNDEIATNSTHYKNHIGFNKSDAKVLSQIAKDKLDGKELDDYQISEISRRMPKYARQIVDTKIRSGLFVKQHCMYNI